MHQHTSCIINTQSCTTPCRVVPPRVLALHGSRLGCVMWKETFKTTDRASERCAGEGHINLGFAFSKSTTSATSSKVSVGPGQDGMAATPSSSCHSCQCRGGRLLEVPERVRPHTNNLLPTCFVSNLPLGLLENDLHTTATVTVLLAELEEAQKSKRKEKV